MSKNLLHFTLLMTFGTLVALVPIGSAYYLTFYTNNTLTPGENATIVGSFHNTTPGEDVVYLNVTASFPGGNFSNTGMASVVVNSTNSTFTLYLNTSNFTEYALATGDNALSITTNGTAAKTATVRITNVSSATVEFVENLPPFFLGSKITAKVTARFANNTLIPNQNVSAKIYAADGARPSWGSNTSETGANGIAYINFTIPSTAASGTYVLSVENGAGVSMFVIKQYIVTLKTKDTTGTNKVKYSPGDQVTVETAITSGGNLTNVDSVICDFIDANNLVTNVTGTNTTTGVYQCNLTTSSTAQAYKVRVTTTLSSVSQTSYTTFSTQSFTVRLAPRSGMGFFQEFGGKKSFTVGQKIQMDIIVTNVSTGELFTAGTHYNCTASSGNITIADTWVANNGTSVNSTLTNDAIVSGTYMMTSGCYLEFKLDAEATGVFGVKVNVSGPGGDVVAGQGYFSINKYLLKVEPATMFGGMDFHILLKPGENASFKLSAYNLTDGSELYVGNITNAGLTRITPLSFTGAIRESSIAEGNASFVNGSASKYLSIVVPASTGPHLLSVWATVAGENVTGEAFYMGKYIMGFAGPSGNIFGGPGGEKEGPGGEGGSPTGGTIKCTVGKTIEFTAMTIDASTMQPVKGVNFLSILEGREEMTGKSVRHCFTSTKAISNTNGQATFNFTFRSGTGCSDLSGFYFVVFNVSWKDKQDEIPAFFECRQLNINPFVEPWDAQSTSVIQVNVSNATYANGSNVVVTSGNISFVSLMNFNPNIGGQVLTAKTDHYLNGTLEWALKDNQNYSVGSLSLSPSNFTAGGKNLTAWPDGFYDGRVRICDNTTDTCDTGFFGFGIMPFRAYTTWWEGMQEERVYAAGDEVTTSIFAQTNISRNESAEGDWTNVTQNYTDSSGFDIKIMSPESQTDYTITNFTFTNAIDDSDQRTQFMAAEGWQKWNLSFQLPTTLQKGWYMGFITVNNTNGSVVDMFVDFRVRSYVVGIPHKEKLQASPNTAACEMIDMFNCTINATDEAEASECGWRPKAEVQALTGWNETSWGNFTATYGIDVAGEGEVCGYKHFNLTAEESQSGAGASPNTDYNVLVFGNSTDNIFVLKNSSTENETLERIMPTQLISNTKQYLVKSEGPWYSVFINATNTTADKQETSAKEGFVKAEWGWGGMYETNKSFNIPFIVIKSDSPISGINVTIENMVQMETAGFGVVGMFSSEFYDTSIAGQAGNVTDSNGIAWVPLNITKVGKYKPFWKLNNSAADTGSFDRSPVIDVVAFYSWGQFVTLYPQGVNNVTLNATDADTVYLNNYHPINASIFFNGTFQEQSGQEFIVDGRLDKWYFTLANTTSSYNKLYIDNDTYANISIGGDDTWGSTDEMTSTSEISVEIGQTRYGIAEHYFINSTQNISRLVFYDPSSRIEQYTITSANQSLPVQLCAENLQYKGLNATLHLQWINWMSTIGPPVVRNMSLYNVTTGTETDNVNTSTRRNAGCIVVKVRPRDSNDQVTSWETGMTEITGSVRQLDASGNPTGETQQIWAGQAMYLPSGYGTL